MDKIRIKLYDFLLCISKAQDLVSHKLNNHQQMVAYLSYKLVEQLDLSSVACQRIFMAGLVHDIGSLSSNEKLEIVEAETPNINSHAFRGAKLIDCFKPTQEISDMIRYHHIPWENGKGRYCKDNEIPLESHILHLADRVCVKIKPAENILVQIPQVIAEIKQNAGIQFNPGAVAALEMLAQKESVWLDLISKNPADTLPDVLAAESFILGINDIIDLSQMFSQIIDFRSKFTARHSAGVANTAKMLAELVGFSPYECKLMLVAGHLHDIGKLAISNDILEKPGKLDDSETKIMRTHTYYTYRLLEPINEFKVINEWASFHHERLDGNGYPFHLNDSYLSYGSRIMAVADVFTAITENRPYRVGMEDSKAMKVLKNMVTDKALDRNVTEILLDNFTEINKMRAEAQAAAKARYEQFMKLK
ncbi:MAG: hypothetical protein A2Y17_01625 [Clostridiales bacterium GWF2_38_85]|nr:MAG: hypothetical protein A2Y17_01625 [Clostridiales bacterium GWF2_38_85]HBL84792.1 phosphohydrolase [Clostridiales bacterium]